LPFFFGADISTQLPFLPFPNHAVNPPLGFAIMPSYIYRHEPYTA